MLCSSRGEAEWGAGNPPALYKYGACVCSCAGVCVDKGSVRLQGWVLLMFEIV